VLLALPLVLVTVTLERGSGLLSAPLLDTVAEVLELLGWELLLLPHPASVAISTRPKTASSAARRRCRSPSGSSIKPIMSKPPPSGASGPPPP